MVWFTGAIAAGYAQFVRAAVDPAPARLLPSYVCLSVFA